MRSYSMILRAFAVSMFLLPGAASVAQFVQPTALEANDPRGRKATELATLLGKGDYAAAAQYLQANAVPGSEAASNPAAQIQALQGQYGAGGFVLRNVMQGVGTDVIVVMMKDGENPAILNVDVDQAAPHGIKAVRAMQGMRRRG